MSSPTPNKNYTYPVHGGAVNAWDSPLNADFDAIDLNLGGTYNIVLGAYGSATYNSTNATIPSTAGTITLTSSLANNLHYSITGTIGANTNLTFPSAFAGIVDITNSSSGSFALTTSISGSTAATTPVGRGSQVFVSDMTTMFTGDTNGIQSYLGNPNGNVAGTAATINGGLSDMIWDVTDQLIYMCTTTGDAASAVWTVPTTTISRGFDTAVNLSLAATHTGGNLLNIAVKTASGADPSASSPVVCEFQTLSGSATTGGITSVSITSALSMTSNAVGATLGTSNNVPFRFWIAIFNNGGTPVLAIRNCSTSTAIYSLAEYGVASTTGISGAATSAGVWYTPNGTTLSNCAFRIIGYCEYTSGIATAGTYTSDPSNVVIFGPGIKKPGDVVQTVYSSTTTTTSVSSTAKVATALTGSITPTSAVNLIKVHAYGTVTATTFTSGVLAQIYRNTGSTAVGSDSGVLGAGSGQIQGAGTVVNFAFDNPNVSTSTQYGIYIKLVSGTSTVVHLGTGGSFPTNTGVMIIEEIMG